MRKRICALDEEGRVVRAWEAIGESANTPQTSAGLAHDEIDADTFERIKTAANAGRGYYRDPDAREYRERREWKPRGLPAVKATIGKVELREVEAPSTHVLEWDDPAGPIRLTINGHELLATSPFELTLNRPGIHAIEVTDPRWHRSRFEISVGQIIRKRAERA